MLPTSAQKGTLDQIKGNEICGTCSTHGRDEKFRQNFG